MKPLNIMPRKRLRVSKQPQVTRSLCAFQYIFITLLIHIPNSTSSGAQYAKAVDDYQDADKKSNATTYILTLVQNFIIQAGLLAGGLLCAYQVTQGQKTIG